MKQAVVTGASTGIGKATALKFAAEGYHVFLVARSADKLEQVASEIEERGGSATVMVTDLSEIDQVKELIESISERAGQIDAIINIAGIWHGPDQVFAGTNYAEFDAQVILDTYTVGLTAPSLLVHGLVSKMPAGGKVVNLSGTFETGAKGWLPYFVSKRALEDFTVGLAQELEDKNIQVNAVSPSDTATEAYAKFFRQYLDEAVQPEEIAQEILKLCDEENTNTGQIVVVKYGQEPFVEFHY